MVRNSGRSTSANEVKCLTEDQVDQQLPVPALALAVTSNSNPVRARPIDLRRPWAHPQERRRVYLGLFRVHIDDDTLAALKERTNKGGWDRGGCRRLSVADGELGDILRTLDPKDTRNEFGTSADLCLGEDPNGMDSTLS